jgi:superfamily II DNA or RNA helicase
MPEHKPGTFEYLEAKIRREANGTLFGKDFEWICKWYLENAPMYRGKFRHVWPFMEWSERWGPDCGVDLIAETYSGEIWAIQAKAISANDSITKAQVDSFLSDSANTKVNYRLLIATTDWLAPHAERTIRLQEKRTAVIKRGDLLSDDLVWPTAVGGSTPPQNKAKPEPHQLRAIGDTLRGFRKHSRGQLIMACGTGKTLTGLWIHEKLKSRRTLLLVPSISLAQQNLREWGRHAQSDFDCLVVCSDESVGSDRDDPAIRYVAEMGIDPTTDSAKIAAFLSKRRQRPAVVISTYHSADRVSAGQQLARKAFDLALCDEAHRLVGRGDQRFALALDDQRIKAKRRLFMTATPKRLPDHIAKAIRDADLEPVSMNDPQLFGPEFHVLSFYDAINANPPLLTDYRVVIVGVNDKEAASWVDEGRLVRTRRGAEVDARTLASQIGLAKAIREYDLRRVITFHRSIRRAAHFVQEDRRESFPALVASLRASKRPSGKLWARHISGETPASQRASMLRALAEVPDGTRGIVSNCACLGEGVDVPALDGIAFIDPKRSVVDIIQAVGRVIRKSKNKTTGTIVIPVFIDETGDANDALEQSAFAPVWQVLKALRAHDQRLAVELDAIRSNLGTAGTGHIRLPANIVLNIPPVLLDNFEQAFYVRAVEQATTKPPLTVERILEWADLHKAATGKWPTQNAGTIEGTNENWSAVSQCLFYGLRSLPGGETLSQLLAKHRGHQPKNTLPPLTYADILAICDAYFQAHGTYPDVKSGYCESLAMTFHSLDGVMRQGRRGLTKRITLAQLLAAERGKRNPAGLPALTQPQIKQWILEFHKTHGRYPRRNDGPIPNSHDTWETVANAMLNGLRGLTSRKTLRRYVADTFDAGARLTESKVLKWCDEYRAQHGNYPNSSTTGPIPGTTETWQGIVGACGNGTRGLKRTLPQLLAARRGVRNIQNAAALTVDQILRWARSHKRRTGKWPTATSGPIPNTLETWSGIDVASKRGRRGLSQKRSLAQLLADEAGVRYRLAPCDLTIGQILEAADEYRRKTGRFPVQQSGYCDALSSKWANVDLAIRRGRVPGNHGSLAKLLADKRGKPLRVRGDLTVEQIVKWIMAYRDKHGRVPSAHSGPVPGTDETFIGIDLALRKGARGLPPGLSIARLATQYLGHQNKRDRPPLSEKLILRWADEHKKSTGRWPTESSGNVLSAPGEKWINVTAALRSGGRKLPGGSSLYQLLVRSGRVSLTRPLRSRGGRRLRRNKR